MRALVLDGRTEQTTFNDMAFSSLLNALENQGYEAEVATLREKTINHCRGCFGCWLESPGICVIEDDAREITKRMVQSGIVVYFSPIVFGGYSHLLKKQIDRSIGIVHPFFERIGNEYHHRKRYDRYPCILGVGILEDTQTDLGDLFRIHIQRNELNFHSPSSRALVLSSELQSQELDRAIELELQGWRWHRDS